MSAGRVQMVPVDAQLTTMRIVRCDVYDDMLTALREYRAECEGLGMPRTVAEIDALLERANAA